MPWKTSNVMDQKEQFVIESLQHGVKFAAICRQYGISPVTGYVWRERFLREGRAGLYERSRRPRGHPDQLKEEMICEIVRLKHTHRTFGPEKVRAVYERAHGSAPSLSSFKRVLAKAGLVQPRRVRRRAEPMSRPAVVLRPTAPNQIWSTDFKGWWPTAEGRCEPLTVRDCYSRFVVGVTAMATTRTAAVRQQFERWFEQYGLPQVIHTDNGAPFACTRSPLGLSQLSAWWVALGIQLSRGRPGHPQDNGGHERMHRDLEEAVQPAITHAGVCAQALLDQWQHEFNCVRPHRALGLRCPNEVYCPSARRYVGTPELIDYGPSFESRRISSTGSIMLHRQHYFISGALKGWNVGLKPLAADSFELWFDCLLLGHLDLKAARFIWARPDEAPVR
jgi:putative transposase